MQPILCCRVFFHWFISNFALSDFMTLPSLRTVPPVVPKRWPPAFTKPSCSPCPSKSDEEWEEKSFQSLASVIQPFSVLPFIVWNSYYSYLRLNIKCLDVSCLVQVADSPSQIQWCNSSEIEWHQHGGSASAKSTNNPTRSKQQDAHGCVGG